MSAADVNRNLDAYVRRTLAAMEALGNHFALKMEGEAKVGARWTDRMGHARQGLFGEAVLLQHVLAVRIAHTMGYGIYLELKNQGKFAILDEVLNANAPEFFENMARLIGGTVR